MSKFKCLVALLVFIGLFTSCHEKDNGNEPLKQKIGQMVMIGFRGTSLHMEDPLYQMLKDYHIGGVVLYSKDLPSKFTQPRNVESPEQLKQLTRVLQSIDSIPMFIAIDEEGGNVKRLDPQDGFVDDVSHQKIGAINNVDTTRVWANTLASELSDMGINMNFGPVLDLNVNPVNPIIGGRERSFSRDVDTVLVHGKIFVEEHRKNNIVTVPKHFPGHGSSEKDSHKGLSDITKTWSPRELRPFEHFIEKGFTEVIMTCHVYNENLDTLPATLSPKIIGDLLRGTYGFDGLIISDDMHMRAISNFYDFEISIEKALLAGVDMLLFSNNAYPCPEDEPNCVKIPYDPKIAQKAVDHIYALVEEGTITEEQIEKSYQRILKVKQAL